MIRVLIERRLKEGVEEKLQAHMRELRREAIHRPGYVSGETLRDVDDDRHFVILSSWRSQAEWRSWAASQQRRDIEAVIGALLAEPEKVTVFEVV